MTKHVPEWLAPTSLAEALELRARLGDEATVVAGGTFIGILMRQRLMQPAALLTLRSVRELAFIAEQHSQGMMQPGSQDKQAGQTGPLRIGAMTTHRAVERSAVIHEHWPILAYTFSLVASPRVRNQATVGGVLADADYASDPPALLHALDARAIARSLNGEREIAIADLITGYYETSLRADELLVEVRIPHAPQRAVYRKFRSRSSEDRPCVAVAATQLDGRLRVVVGAVAERPRYFPEICALADGSQLNRELASKIGQLYAEAIDPISDARGSAAYRRRIIAVEVRRALEELSKQEVTE